MKRTLLAAALMLTGLSTHAATFDLSLVGSGTHWYVDGVPGCDWANPADGCNYGFATENWLGELTVQTVSSADGTYGTDTGLQALTYSSGIDSFTYVAGDSQRLVYPQFNAGEPYLAGMVPGVSVTVVGGRVVSVRGSFIWACGGSVDFDGLTALDSNGGQAGQPDSDWWKFSGVLADGASPTSSPAPEQPSWVLFVLGVLALTRIAPCAGKCLQAPSRS